MERMRVVHISLHVAVCTLATLLLCVCLAGCESTGMGEFGSSRDTSALWNQQVPEGGGAILIMGDDSSRFWKTYQFDAGGTLVASESFNSDGGTWSVSYYHYDQGRLSSVTGSCEGGGPNTERSFETTYSYHDDGSLNVSRREDGTLTMTKSYDAAGRIVESNAVTSNDRETFEYDDQGRQTAHWHYGSHGDEIDWPSSQTYEYGTDDQGDFERMYYYDRDTQQPDSCCTNWLDSEGRVVRSVRSTLRDDGTWALDGSSIETCTYDETVEYYPNTNKVSSRTKTRDSSDPASAESSTTIYDEQGFLVSYARTAYGKTHTTLATYRGNVPAGFLDDGLDAPKAPSILD